MEHKGTVRIETERLVLKRHVLEDAEIMFKNWVAEKEVTKFMSWQPHKNVEETRNVLRRKYCDAGNNYETNRMCEKLY